MEIKISTPYIKLGQFLKYIDLISTGGEEKHFLIAHDIFVNDILEKRRGRKLYPGDKIKFEAKTYLIV